jgi:hypothetical protein
MAHHWSEMDPDMQGRLADLVEINNKQRQDVYDAFRRKMPDDSAEPVGATGRFPEGKVTDSDEGEIRFSVVADPEAHKVFIDFGKPVHVIGLTLEQTADLVSLLMERLRYAK